MEQHSLPGTLQPPTMDSPRAQAFVESICQADEQRDVHQRLLEATQTLDVRRVHRYFADQGRERCWTRAAHNP